MTKSTWRINLWHSVGAWSVGRTRSRVTDLNGQSSMGRSTFRMGYSISIHDFKASSIPCVVRMHHFIIRYRMITQPYSAVPRISKCIGTGLLSHIPLRSQNGTTTYVFWRECVIFLTVAVDDVWVEWIHILSSCRFPLAKFTLKALDYPPFFAYFEKLLSIPAFFIDPKIVDVNNLNYDLWSVIAYQRATVIITELVLGIVLLQSVLPYFIVISLSADQVLHRTASYGDQLIRRCNE